MFIDPIICSLFVCLFDPYDNDNKILYFKIKIERLCKTYLQTGR